MTMWGVTSVVPVALPALAKATGPLAAAKNRTKTGKEKNLPPAQVASPPSVSDTYVPPPPNESKMETAKKHFRVGKKYYEKKEYGTALDEFQKSYDLIRILDTQYNIGLCYEKLGALDKAITALQFYVDGKPGKEEKEEAEARIAWIQAQIKKQQKKEEPSEKVAVVAPVEEETPKPKPIRPAKTKIRIPNDQTWKMPYAEGPPPSPPKVIEAPPTVEGKQQGPVLPPSLPLAKDAYVDPANAGNTTVDVIKTPSPSKISYRNLMWTSVGLSSAGLIAGLIGHFGARNAQAEHAKLADQLEADGQIVVRPNGTRDFRDQQAADDNNNKSRLDSFESDTNTYGTVMVTGFVSSALFLGLGGTFYWLDKKHVHLSATPLANGGAVTLEGGF